MAGRLPFCPTVTKQVTFNSICCIGPAAPLDLPPVERLGGYVHWSPDRRRILLGVAGHGTDIAGGQSAVTLQESRRGGSVLDAGGGMPS